MLFSINIPHNLIKLIMSCISSSQLAVLINGSPTPYFEPTKGIHAKAIHCHLIPSSCVWNIFHEQVKLNNWTPISPCEGCPLISHTLFADDIFLFAEANHTNITAIHNVLSKFSNISGLSINYSKFKLFFSTNCDQISRR